MDFIGFLEKSFLGLGEQPQAKLAILIYILSLQSGAASSGRVGESEAWASLGLKRWREKS
jgi:hypothetical protein